MANMLGQEQQFEVATFSTSEAVQPMYSMCEKEIYEGRAEHCTFTVLPIGDLNLDSRKFNFGKMCPPSSPLALSCRNHNV